VDIDLGKVIAERIVEWIPNEGPAGQVSILVGTPPESDDQFGSVIVPFQIRGLGRERVKYAAGVDGIQAFLLMLRMIRVDLEILQRDLNGRLVWLGDESGTCGLVAPEEA
jgi:hypothetical protein